MKAKTKQVRTVLSFGKCSCTETEQCQACIDKIFFEQEVLPALKNRGVTQWVNFEVTN